MFAANKLTKWHFQCIGHCNGSVPDIFGNTVADCIAQLQEFEFYRTELIDPDAFSQTVVLSHIDNAGDHALID